MTPSFSTVVDGFPEDTRHRSVGLILSLAGVLTLLVSKKRTRQTMNSSECVVLYWKSTVNIT